VSDLVVIVGGGAMGGAFAGALATSGQDVTIVEVSPQVIDAISQDGLRVETAESDHAHRVPITNDAASIGRAGVVLLFVKAGHTRAAAGTLAPLVGPSTVVASLQNGWGNADIVAETVSPDQLAVGVTYHSATVAAPGRIRHTARGATFVGPYVDGAGLEGAERVASVLRRAGFEATATAAVKTEIWRKLVLNVATLPTSALTGSVSGRLGEDGLIEVVDELAREAVRVARGQGYEIEEAERLNRIHAVIAAGGTGRSSMLQDVQAHRPTEIDTVCGAVVRAADRLGIAVPLNRAMVGLVHALERSWDVA
jgi:2-dehydropantoate 2-reductase